MTIFKKLQRKKKAVVKKSSAPGRLELLLADALWLVGVLIYLFSCLCLISYSQTDPAWSKSSAATEVHNLGGVIGAYFSDILYYFFGLSAWWLVVVALICLIKTFHTFAEDSNKSP